MGFWKKKAAEPSPAQGWPPKEADIAAIAEAHGGLLGAPAHRAISAGLRAGEKLRALAPAVQRNGVISWLGLTDIQMFVIWGVDGYDVFEDADSVPNPRKIPFGVISALSKSPLGVASVLILKQLRSIDEPSLAVTDHFVSVLRDVLSERSASADQEPLAEGAYTTPYEELAEASFLWHDLWESFPPPLAGWYVDPLNGCLARRCSGGAWTSTAAPLVGPATLSRPPPAEEGDGPAGPVPLWEVKFLVHQLSDHQAGLWDEREGFPDPRAEPLRLGRAAREWLVETPTNWATARHQTDDLARRWVANGGDANTPPLDEPALLYDVVAAHAAYGWALAKVESHWGWAGDDFADANTVRAMGIPPSLTGEPATLPKAFFHWTSVPDRPSLVLAGYLSGRDISGPTK